MSDDKLLNTTYKACRVVQRETANGKDFADGDDDVAEEEELHFPAYGQFRSFSRLNMSRTFVRQQPSSVVFAIAAMRWRRLRGRRILWSL